MKFVEKLPLGNSGCQSGAVFTIEMHSGTILRFTHRWQDFYECHLGTV